MDSLATAAPPDRAILWVPRLLALAVSLFAGVFSLDAFGNGTPFLQALPDFLIHLVPAAIVVAVVALAWRREWIGAVIFTILSAAYAVASARSGASRKQGVGRYTATGGADWTGAVFASPSARRRRSGLRIRIAANAARYWAAASFDCFSAFCIRSLASASSAGRF